MSPPSENNDIERLKGAHSAALISRFVRSTHINETDAKSETEQVWATHGPAIVEFAARRDKDELSVDHFAFNCWLMALIDRARAGDEKPYTSLRTSFDHHLTGRIKASTHASKDACEKLATEIWDQSRVAILKPAGDGGFHPDWPIPFHVFVFNAHLVRLIGLARGGDTEAEDALRQLCSAALAETIRFRLGYAEKDSPVATDQLWAECRDAILRPPEDGGFSAATAILFHTFVLNCTDWVRGSRGKQTPKWMVSVFVRDDGVALDPADTETRDAADRLVQKEVFRRVIWLLFHENVGSPHQQLALLYSKFVYGSVNAGGKMQGDVDRTYYEHGQTTFYDLTEEFVAGSPIDLEAADGFSPMELFRARLRESIQKVYLKDASNRDWLAGRGLDLDRACVGGLRFKDFLRPSAREDLEPHQKQMPDWCNRVITRIKKRFGSRHDLSP